MHIMRQNNLLGSPDLIECGQDAILYGSDTLAGALISEQGDMNLVQAPDQESWALLKRPCVPDQAAIALSGLLQHQPGPVTSLFFWPKL